MTRYGSTLRSISRVIAPVGEGQPSRVDAPLADGVEHERVVGVDGVRQRDGGRCLGHARVTGYTRTPHHARVDRANEVADQRLLAPAEGRSPGEEQDERSGDQEEWHGADLKAVAAVADGGSAT